MYTRRIIIKQFVSIISFGIFSYCGNKEKETNSNNPCSDLANLSESELKARNKFNYIAESKDKTKTCDHCNLYIPSSDVSCGTCMLFKGSVKPGGSCTYWAPKPNSNEL
jgi:hypothetical protein